MKGTDCKDCASYVKKIQIIRKTIEELNSEKEGYIKKLTVVMDKNVKITSNNNDMKENIDKLENELRAVRAELSNTEKAPLTLDLLKKSVKELESDLIIKDKYIETLREDDVALKKTLKEKQILIKELTETKGFVSDTKELETLKDNVLMLKASVLDFKKESKSQEDKITDLKSQIDILKDSRTKLSEENLKLQNDLNLKTDNIVSGNEDVARQLCTMKDLYVSQSNQLRQLITNYCKNCKNTASIVFDCFNNKLDYSAHRNNSRVLIDNYKEVKVTLLSHIQTILVDEMFGDDDMQGNISKLVEGINNGINEAAQTKTKRKSTERSPSFESVNYNGEVNNNEICNTVIDKSVASLNDWQPKEVYNKGKTDRKTPTRGSKSCNNSSTKQISPSISKSRNSTSQKPNYCDSFGSCTSDEFVLNVGKENQVNISEISVVLDDIVSPRKRGRRPKKVANKVAPKVTRGRNKKVSEAETVTEISLSDLVTDLERIEEVKRKKLNESASKESFSENSVDKNDKVLSTVAFENLFRHSISQKSHNTVIQEDVETHLKRTAILNATDMEVSKDSERATVTRCAVVTETEKIQINKIITNEKAKDSPKKKICGKNAGKGKGVVNVKPIVNKGDILDSESATDELFIVANVVPNTISSSVATETMPVKEIANVMNSNATPIGKENVDSPSKRNGALFVGSNENVQSTEKSNMTSIISKESTQGADSIRFEEQVGTERPNPITASTPAPESVIIISDGESEDDNYSQQYYKSPQTSTPAKTNSLFSFPVMDYRTPNTTPSRHVHTMQTPLDIDYAPLDLSTFKSPRYVSDRLKEESVDVAPLTAPVSTSVEARMTDVVTENGAFEIRQGGNIRNSDNGNQRKRLHERIFGEPSLPKKICNLTGSGLKEMQKSPIAVVREASSDDDAEGELSEEKKSENVQDSAKTKVNSMNMDAEERNSGNLGSILQKKTIEGEEKKNIEINLHENPNSKNIDSAATSSKSIDQEKLDEIKKRTDEAKEISKRKALATNQSAQSTNQSAQSTNQSAQSTHPNAHVSILPPKLVLPKSKSKLISVMDKVKRTVRQSQINQVPINQSSLHILERSTKADLSKLVMSNTSVDYITGTKRSRPDNDEIERPAPKRHMATERRPTVAKTTTEPSKFTTVRVAQMLNRCVSIDSVERFERLSHFVAKNPLLPEIETPVAIAVTKGKFEDFYSSNCAFMGEELKSKIFALIQSMSESELTVWIDEVIEFVRKVSVASETDGTTLVRVSSLVLLNTIVANKALYSHYYKVFLDTVQAASSRALVNLIIMNTTILICLKQFDVIVSFLVDLISVPTVPMLLIAKCLRPSMVSTILPKYASFLRLLKLLVAFEYSTDKHANNKLMFSQLSGPSQQFWLDGRDCGNFERCTDLGVVVAAVKKVQEEFENVDTKANFSFLEKIIVNKYK